MSTVTYSGVNRTTRQDGGRTWTVTSNPVTANPAAPARPRSKELRRAQRWRTGWVRWTGIGLTGAGVAMVPWLGVLAAGLPARFEAAHWNAAWVGLDALEALGLFATGTLLRRRDARAALTAAATSTLLLIDAWFDVVTSGAAGRPMAIAMAAGAELPLSALCAGLAVRTFPRGTA